MCSDIKNILIYCVFFSSLCVLVITRVHVKGFRSVPLTTDAYKCPHCQNRTVPIPLLFGSKLQAVEVVFLYRSMCSLVTREKEMCFFEQHIVIGIPFIFLLQALCENYTFQSFLQRGNTLPAGS